MFTGIIWDFDGTLVDTYPVMTDCAVRAVSSLGFNADYNEVYSLMKSSMLEAVNYYGGILGIAPERIREKYHELASESDVALSKPYPYITEILSAFCESGGRSFIFTHRGRSVNRYLEHYGMAKFFTAVISSHDGFERKPSPSGNMHIIERYGLRPDRTLAVGDREIDILAAKNAGIKSCLFAEDSIPENTTADFVIRDFTGLADILGLKL